MVTCYLKYVIDPYKVNEFEEYSKMWIPLVNKLGGIHHAYLSEIKSTIVIFMLQSYENNT